MADPPQSAPSTSEPGRESITSNDLLTNLMGSFGRYQCRIYTLVILTKFVIAFHQFAIIFLAPKLTFTCSPNEQLTNNSTNTNSTDISECPCLNPQYDSKVFSQNIITEWNLICENRWMIGFTQTLFQFGNLVGSTIYGSMSDRCGRRMPMIVASMGMLFSGVAAAYMPTYWAFTLMRFFLGTCVGGTLVLGFVIIMEFVGDNHRELFSALYQLPFNIGHVLLPGIAYNFEDFRKFQLCISLVAVILILYIFFLPETPRWLLAVNQTEKCIKLVEKVAKVNKRPEMLVRSQIAEFKTTPRKKKGTCLDLFRTPNLRKNILIMAFTWTTTSYCFYGVSQFVGTLSGNIYINVEISAAVTLCGCFLSIPLMKCFGRRTIIITMNFLCSICLLNMAFFNENTVGVILATVGTVSSFIAFVVVYLYTCELFPTVVRSAAVGNSSMMARLGSMIAPFVVLLEDVNSWLTPVLFGVPPFITACLLFLLPETKGLGLLTTIEEGERFGTRKKFKSSVGLKKPPDEKDENLPKPQIKDPKTDETKTTKDKNIEGKDSPEPKPNKNDKTNKPAEPKPEGDNKKPPEAKLENTDKTSPEAKLEHTDKNPLKEKIENTNKSLSEAKLEHIDTNPPEAKMEQTDENPSQVGLENTDKKYHEAKLEDIDRKSTQSKSSKNLDETIKNDKISPESKLDDTNKSGIKLEDKNSEKIEAHLKESPSEEGENSSKSKSENKDTTEQK